MMFQVSAAWRAAFPGAHAGVLVMRDVCNPPFNADLARHKEALEEQLRLRFAGHTRSDLEALPILQAYDAYYKRFKKTYHVQLQLESIALKGKSIPSVAALVESMFMAEVKNLLLTAGHDLDELRLPVVLGVSRGDETYTLLRGQPQQLKAGDMMMSDGEGIISSVIYGPDQRTQIHAGTSNAMFTVYAPSGISEGAVRTHLQDIAGYVRSVAQDARVEMIEVFGYPDGGEPSITGHRSVRFQVVVDQAPPHGDLFELEQTTHYRVVDTRTGQTVLTFRGEMRASLSRTSGMWDDYSYSGVREVAIAPGEESILVTDWDGRTEIVPLPR